jgi:hypothetical protein
MRCLLAAVLAAGIVSMVAAQPGGRGGFGGNQDVYALVLTNAELQKEVKVTDAQKDKFKAVAEKRTEMNKKVREKYGKEAFTEAKGDKEKMTELFEGMQKENAKVSEETHKLVDAELTPEQKARLKQIGIQMVGLDVFNDPDGKNQFGFPLPEAQKETMKEVQGALKLSASQKTSIKNIVAEFNKERGEIFKDAGITFGRRPDPEKMEVANKKVNKVRREAWDKVDEALDDSQKKAWKELVGEAFDTSKLFGPPPKAD